MLIFNKLQIILPELTRVIYLIYFLSKRTIGLFKKIIKRLKRFIQK